MKTVMNTEQVIHVWANQGQEYATNPSRNMQCKGDRLISYGHYTIGRIVKKGKTKRSLKTLVLLQENRYSVTTAKQINWAWSATRQFTRIFVSALSDHPGLDGIDHERNIRYFKSEIERLDTKLKHTRLGADWLDSKLRDQIKAAKFYVKFFGLKAKFKSSLSDEFREEKKAKSAAAVAARDLKNAEQRMLAQIEYDRKQAERLPELNAKLASWEAGDNVYSYDIGTALRLNNRGTALRVKGETVQTSEGAEFPVAHAKLGLALVRKVVASGKPYERNGHTLHLGHFAIDKIDADGTVRAGCHVVPLAEIERIAPELEAHV